MDVDKTAQTLSLLHLSRYHAKLKLRRNLTVNGGPRVKGIDTLTTKLLWYQVVKQHIQLTDRIADGRSGEHTSTEILSSAVLNGTHSVAELIGQLITSGLT